MPNFAVPRTVVWQCQISQCHARKLCGATYVVIWQCQSWQFDVRKFGSATYVVSRLCAKVDSAASSTAYGIWAVPLYVIVRQCQSLQCHVRKFDTTTYGGLAVPNLVVPRTRVLRGTYDVVWQGHVRKVGGATYGSLAVYQVR